MRRRSQQAWAEREAWSADEALLARRLHELGLIGVRRVAVHENRSVLASVTPQKVLRLHRGYAYAPDAVLEAVVRFARPGATARERRAARRIIAEFDVGAQLPPSRSRPPRERAQPGDRKVLSELRRLHAEYNERHFCGALKAVRFRLSGRMETRLGEIEVATAGRTPLVIAISRRHVAEDGWDEVRQTLLHEMIHQWQLESGLAADHGAVFRRKAREIGVVPSARRTVGDVRQV